MSTKYQKMLDRIKDRPKLVHCRTCRRDFANQRSFYKHWLWSPDPLSTHRHCMEAEDYRWLPGWHKNNLKEYYYDAH